MILPIVAYGDAVLKKKAKEINKEYPKLDVLLENMYDTMYGAMGVGLAAQKHNIPVIAISGALGENAQALHECGIQSIYSVYQVSKNRFLM